MAVWLKAFISPVLSTLVLTLSRDITTFSLSASGLDLKSNWEDEKSIIDQQHRGANSKSKLFVQLFKYHDFVIFVTTHQINLYFFCKVWFGRVSGVVVFIISQFHNQPQINVLGVVDCSFIPMLAPPAHKFSCKYKTDLETSRSFDIRTISRPSMTLVMIRSYENSVFNSRAIRCLWSSS